MTDQRIKTLDNAIKLLDILVEHQSLGVSEIARQAHLSKTTVFRLLKALEVHHLVLQIDQENYALGYGMLKYQPLEANSQQIISLAKPYMKNFTEVTGETINLAIHYDNYVYFIHTEVGESYLLQFSLAPTAKLYCSSMGKIFLSQMADSDLKSYFQEDLVARTHHTITSYQAFKEEKKAILKNGVAYDLEEYEYGLTCMATGLFQNNSIIAALGCSGPSSRLAYKGLSFLEEELKKTATAINQLLN